MLKGLVEQQGSGLVFVPGRRGGRPLSEQSPLKDLFPVELEPRKPGGIGLENESQLVLTSTGKRHWLTRFDSDEERNDELWKQLPGFFWSAAVEKSRPGSEVLAVHCSLRNQWGRMPLLVTRPAGNGKVLFLGTDSAWRWRRGVEDKFHYRFWGQVVRWMAHQRHLSEKDGMRLSYSPGNSRKPATLSSCKAPCWTNPDFLLTKARSRAKSTSPAGRTERLDFARSKAAGAFSNRASSRRKPVVIKWRFPPSPTTAISSPNCWWPGPMIEKEGQPVNAQILGEISSLTRGATFSMADVDKMVNQIALLPQPKPVERRVRVWSDPAWGGGILFLLTLYWVGRKWAGLV